MIHETIIRNTHDRLLPWRLGEIEPKMVRQLFSSLIEQALHDASWQPESVGSPVALNTIRNYLRHAQTCRQARVWLLFDENDFPLICSLAGLDPATVRETACRICAKPVQYVGDHRSEIASQCMKDVTINALQSN